MKVINQDPSRFIPDVTENTFTKKLVVAVLTLLNSRYEINTYMGIATKEAELIKFRGVNIAYSDISLSSWFGSTNSFIGLLINLWRYFPNDNPIVYIIETKEDLLKLLDMYDVRNKCVLERLESHIFGDQI